MLTRGRLRRIFRREQVLGVHDACLQFGVECAAVEGLENALVGATDRANRCRLRAMVAPGAPIGYGRNRRRLRGHPEPGR